MYACKVHVYIWLNVSKGSLEFYPGPVVKVKVTVAKYKISFRFIAIILVQ